jgi:UDP-3-O-[3-hydroxymyristoyl] glucosamine N-acyltransferase
VGASEMEDAAGGRRGNLLSAMTAKDLAWLLGESTQAVSQLRRVSAADGATKDCVVFAADERALGAAVASEAGLILADRDAVSEDVRVVRVDDPRYAFAVCARELERASGQSDGETMVHPSAVIQDGAVVGAGCSLGPNVTVYGCVRMGERVIVQAGAVLGAKGFGYVRGKDGEYVLFPQQGLLVIEDDVEIGANTTIDRGALGETRIGRGTKIDNQVHIGHNCVIGKNVVIAAQVGISGSCNIGDGVVMAGQVGLGDHVTIGPGVILGGASGVFPGKTLTGPRQVFMGVPAEPLKDYLKNVARIRRLKS